MGRREPPHVFTLTGAVELFTKRATIVKRTLDAPPKLGLVGIAS